MGLIPPLPRTISYQVTKVLHSLLLGWNMASCSPSRYPSEGVWCITWLGWEGRKPSSHYLALLSPPCCGNCLQDEEVCSCHMTPSIGNFLSSTWWICSASPLLLKTVLTQTNPILACFRMVSKFLLCLGDNWNSSSMCYWPCKVHDLLCCSERRLALWGSISKQVSEFISSGTPCLPVGELLASWVNL